MIKLSTYALTIALLTHRTKAECQGVFSTLAAGADCNYANFESRALSQGCTADEIENLFVYPLPSLKELQNNLGENAYGLCEGDCDRDSDCQGELVCLQRDNGDPNPPGCVGAPDDSTDYCYDPNYTLTPLTTEDRQAEVEALCDFTDTQFVEIQGTYQLDRTYFAGGGKFVDGLSDWDIDAGNTKRFEDNLSDNTMIGFPEYAARYLYNKETGRGENGFPANMNLETSCELNTIMCCFTDDSAMSSFGDNGDAVTDVCRHDLADSPQSNHINKGWAVFPNSQTKPYCTGFTWKEEDEDTALLGNMMYDISLRQTVTKGYRANVPGAPMCGCVEHMPTVETASCRTASKEDGSQVVYSFKVMYDEEGVPAVGASNTVAIDYDDCAEGDLASQYKFNNGDDDAIDKHLVGAGNCADDLEEYLNDEQFLIAGQDPTKYLTPDPVKWSDLVVGKGIRFQPPPISQAEADGNFRDLINGGCKEEDGTTERHCIILRICDSCPDESHRSIYYKRKTALPSEQEIYLLDMFMNNWSSESNVMVDDENPDGDFMLFSSYDDALAETNAWEYCNYDADRTGFPRECGPYGRKWNQWNSYVRSGGHAHQHGFYVEKA